MDLMTQRRVIRNCLRHWKYMQIHYDSLGYLGLVQAVLYGMYVLGQVGWASKRWKRDPGMAKAPGSWCSWVGLLQRPLPGRWRQGEGPRSHGW